MSHSGFRKDEKLCINSWDIKVGGWDERGRRDATQRNRI